METIVPWIQIHGGYRVNLGSSAELPKLSVMAHSLARLCRFTGAVASVKGYSVAQHCVFVSAHVREVAEPLVSAVYGADKRRAKLALIAAELLGLLHDVPEAVTGDISGPMKAFLDSDKLRLFELDLERKARQKYLPAECFEWLYNNRGDTRALERAVKIADLKALENERLSLLSNTRGDWQVPEPGFRGRRNGSERMLTVRPWGAVRAQRAFMLRYTILCDKFTARFAK